MHAIGHVRFDVGLASACDGGPLVVGERHDEKSFVHDRVACCWFHVFIDLVSVCFSTLLQFNICDAM